ncbi:MAG: hypothetical protein AAFZ15_18905 [Bacteroidota bacterium]
MQRQNTSCNCRKSHRIESKSRFLPMLAGIAIALLPKCPFCVMAYSSAITLCSGAKLYDHSPTWVSYISIFLAVLTLALVLWNYKGRRTWIASLLVLFGSYFILDSELRTGDFENYYWGVGSLLLGVWINGSFSYFYKKYFKMTFQKTKLAETEPLNQTI